LFFGNHSINGNEEVTLDLKEIGKESVEWINLAQVRDLWWIFVNTSVNLRVTRKGGNYN